MKFIDVTEKNDFKLKPWLKHLSTWRLGGEQSEISNDPEHFIRVLESGFVDKYINEGDGAHLEIDLPFLWNSTFKRGDWIERNKRSDFFHKYISIFKQRYPDTFLTWYNQGGWSYIESYNDLPNQVKRMEIEGFYGSLSPAFKKLDACLMSAYYTDKMESAKGIQSYNVSCSLRFEMFKKQNVEVIPVIMPRLEVHGRFLTEHELTAILSFWEGKVHRIALWNHPRDSLENFNI